MRRSAYLILAILKVTGGWRELAKPIPEDCRCGLVNRRTSGDYIQNGEETEANEYPWQVGLILPYRELAFCGGSLISDQWVLTAAHCMIYRNFQVVLGEHDKTPQSSRAGVDMESVKIHPRFNYGLPFNYDFALLKLDSPVDFSLNPNIRPICLPEPNDETYENAEVIATGWGALSVYNRYWKSNELREVKLKVISNEECMRTTFKLTEQMLCAEGQGSVAKGDSGGPLIVKNGQNYEQIGVTSFRYWNQTGETFKSNFARVSKQIEWIKENTGTSFRTCPRQ